MTKLTFAVLSITATLLLPACSSTSTGGIRIGDTRAARIAKEADIPGKGLPGQCLPFANALQQRFQAAGIPSQVIIYGYVASPVPQAGAASSVGVWPGAREAHAVVAYQDAGRTCLMDNQSWAPQWVQDAAPIRMAQQFSGINCDVKMARVLNDSSLQLKAPAATPAILTPTASRLAAE